MALNSLLLNPWAFFLLAIIITLGVIIYLTLIEKVLKKKVVIQQVREENSPARRIKLIRSSNDKPSDKFSKINFLAREIFQRYFNVESRISYDELSIKFKKEGKRNFTKFCELMSSWLYSGAEIKIKDIENLLDLLEKIEKEGREEKRFTILKKSVRENIAKQQGENFFKKLFKTEDKFITKLAKKEPKQEIAVPKKIIKTKPIEKPAEVYESNIDKFMNMPLIKMFRFRKKTTVPQKIEVQKTTAKPWPPIEVSPIALKKKITDEEIINLEREIQKKQSEINKLQTKKQVTVIEEESSKIKVERSMPSVWPPVRIQPKQLEEKRELPRDVSETFKKANKEIEELQEEIQHKQVLIKKLKSSPIERTIIPQIKRLPKIGMQESSIPKEFFKKIEENPEIKKEIKEKQNFIKKLEQQPKKVFIKKPIKISLPKPSSFLNKFFEKKEEAKRINKEMKVKQAQIDIINLRKQAFEHPTYNEPKVKVPRKQKLEAKPKMKKIRQEDLIHDLDSLDRLENKIRERRSGL